MLCISLFVLGLCIATTLPNVEAEKVNVTVYYESLCGDSVKFISELNETYHQIGNYIDLDLIPYGKATQRKENGTWHFTCQHGPEECRGNKIQACAIYQEKRQEKIVEFVSCVMDSANRTIDSHIEACAEGCGFSWEDMKDCTKSALGDELLAGYGNRTHEADPIITSVPTLFFNGKYDPFLETKALQNFTAAVCSVLTEKPSFCPDTSIQVEQYWWL